jgi:hypothetical protein
MIRRSRIAAVPVIALLFAVAALTGCGGSGDKGASPETSSADLTGYWVFAGEQSIAPGYVLRVTSTSDGYLVEPSVLQGIRWSAASRDGEALAARATGPGGATYDVRLEPSGAGAKLTVSPTQGDGQALFEADLARPSGDYADTAAKFAATLAQAQESAVEEGIHNLQIGVQSWMVDHNDRTPPLAVVRPNGGLQSYLDVWPTNPYSGKPMRPGTDPGQYTYERIDTGRDYRLTGHLEGGGDFTVP